MKIFIMFVFLVSINNDAVAQEVLTRENQEEYLTTLFEEHVLGTLNASDRTLLQDCKIKINDSSSPLGIYAQYKPKTDEKVIEFSASSILVLRAVAYTVSVIEQLDGDKEWIDGYFRYLTKLDYFETNSVKKVEDFLSRDQLDILYSPKGKARFEVIYLEMLGSIFTFILRHEAAHHLYGHTRNGGRLPYMSQQQETEADKWAINQTVKTGVPPLAAVPIFSLFDLVNRREYENRARSSHPLSVLRAQEAADATVNEIDNVRWVFELPDSRYNYNQVKIIAERVAESISERAEAQVIKSTYDYNDWIEYGNDGYVRGYLEAANIALIQGDSILGALQLFEYAARNPTKNDYYDTILANYNAGFLYGFHDGVQKNCLKSKRYLKKAAKEKYRPAIHKLIELGECAH